MYRILSNYVSEQEGCVEIKVTCGDQLSFAKKIYVNASYDKKLLINSKEFEFDIFDEFIKQVETDDENSAITGGYFMFDYIDSEFESEIVLDALMYSQNVLIFNCKNKSVTTNYILNIEQCKSIIVSDLKSLKTVLNIALDHLISENTTLDEIEEKVVNEI